MRVEVYGPVRTYKLFAICMVLFAAATTSASYYLYTGCSSERDDLARTVQMLEQRAAKLRTMNQELSDRLAQLAPPATAIPTVAIKPTTPDLVFGDNGVLERTRMKEGGHLLIQGLIEVSVKKITGRRCIVSLAIERIGYRHTGLVEENQVLSFSYKDSVLIFKPLAVNPYDRTVEFLLSRQ